MVVEESVLPPPLRDPISGCTYQVLEAIRMRTQVYNEILNKILDANVGKFSFMSLAYGFMRLACRGNNPARKPSVIPKKHLNYILY